MSQILAGTILISLLHAFIPSHWLPLVSLAKIQKWSEKETIRISLYLAMAHILSTVLVGLALGSLFFGFQFIHLNLRFLGPFVLIASGVYFIYRHHTHHHFHIDNHMMDQTKTRKQIIYALLAFMFLSPCLEIVAYFINASLISWYFLSICIVIYIFISLFGTVIWITLAFRGIKKINSHLWEHNSGIIAGILLLITGLISLFIQ